MKLGEWSVIIFVMIIVLELLGVTTGLGSILNTFGLSINDNVIDNADLEGSAFWAWAAAVLAIATAGGAVVIGLFAKSYDTSLVIAPFIVSTLGLLGSAFFGIISHVQSAGASNWIINIIGVLFAGMGLAVLWSGIDYFAGR